MNARTSVPSLGQYQFLFFILWCNVDQNYFYYIKLVVASRHLQVGLCVNNLLYYTQEKEVFAV
jgi:hypothetical protein